MSSTTVRDLNRTVETTFKELARQAEEADPAALTTQGTRLLEQTRLAVDLAKRQAVEEAGQPTLRRPPADLGASRDQATKAVMSYIEAIGRRVDREKASNEGYVRKASDAAILAELREMSGGRPEAIDRSTRALGLNVDQREFPPQLPVAAIMQRIQVATTNWKMLAEHGTNACLVASDICRGLADLSLAARGLSPIDAAFQGALASALAGPASTSRRNV